MLKNQKYNSYLKEVQDICGLDKVLTTHVGRKTYICYLYQKQVGVETIAAIVGHASCYTTLKYYARMDNKAILDELRRRHVANKTKPETDDKVVSSPEAKKAAKERRRKDAEEKTDAILNILRTTGI